MNNLLKDNYSRAENTCEQDRDNLISAASEAEKIKPFVSLKLFTANQITDASHAALTPASGKAIITYVISGAATYTDSTGKRGVLKKDDWSWIISGSGIWYSIAPTTSDYVAIELCIALSPALENSPPQSAYLHHTPTIPHTPAQVLIGWHGKQRSEFAIPALVNYLVVRLNAHQNWTYDLPLNHQFAWAMVVSGQVQTTGGELLPRQVNIVNRLAEKIELHALTNSLVVVGSTPEFGYDLLAHQHSVHTSSDALHLGLHGIAEARKSIKG